LLEYEEEGIIEFEIWLELHSGSQLTFTLLVLNIPRAQVFSFLQYYDLRRLIVSVLICAPWIASRTFWDGRPTGYGRPARTVVLEFRIQVFVTIIIWVPGDTALKLAQKGRGMLGVGEAGRKLMFCWLFGSHRRGQQL